MSFDFNPSNTNNNNNNNNSNRSRRNRSLLSTSKNRKRRDNITTNNHHADNHNNQQQQQQQQQQHYQTSNDSDSLLSLNDVRTPPRPSKPNGTRRSLSVGSSTAAGSTTTTTVGIGHYLNRERKRIKTKTKGTKITPGSSFTNMNSNSNSNSSRSPTDSYSRNRSGTTMHHSHSHSSFGNRNYQYRPQQAQAQASTISKRSLQRQRLSNDQNNNNNNNNNNGGNANANANRSRNSLDAISDKFKDDNEQKFRIPPNHKINMKMKTNNTNSSSSSNNNNNNKCGHNDQGRIKRKQQPLMQNIQNVTQSNNNNNRNDSNSRSNSNSNTQGEKVIVDLLSSDDDDDNDNNKHNNNNKHMNRNDNHTHTHNANNNTNENENENHHEKTNISTTNNESQQQSKSKSKLKSSLPSLLSPSSLILPSISSTTAGNHTKALNMDTNRNITNANITNIKNANRDNKQMGNGGAIFVGRKKRRLSSKKQQDDKHTIHDKNKDDHKHQQKCNNKQPIHLDANNSSNGSDGNDGSNNKKKKKKKNGEKGDTNDTTNDTTNNNQKKEKEKSSPALDMLNTYESSSSNSDSNSNSSHVSSLDTQVEEFAAIRIAEVEAGIERERQRQTTTSALKTITDATIRTASSTTTTTTTDKVKVKDKDKGEGRDVINTTTSKSTSTSTSTATNNNDPDLKSKSDVIGIRPEIEYIISSGDDDNNGNGNNTNDNTNTNTNAMKNDKVNQDENENDNYDQTKSSKQNDNENKYDKNQEKDSQVNNEDDDDDDESVVVSPNPKTRRINKNTFHSEDEEEEDGGGGGGSSGSSYENDDNNGIEGIDSIIEQINTTPYKKPQKEIKTYASRDRYSSTNANANNHSNTKRNRDNHMEYSSSRHSTPLRELGTPPPPSSSSSSPMRKLKSFGCKMVGSGKKLLQRRSQGLKFSKVNNATYDDIESCSTVDSAKDRPPLSKRKKGTKLKPRYYDDDDFDPNEERRKNKKYKSSSISEEKVDQSFSGSFSHMTRRRTRSQANKKSIKDDIIEIDDDDDDDDDSKFGDDSVFDEEQIRKAVIESRKAHTHDEKKKIGARFTTNVKRIAIGKSVHKDACSLSFQAGGARQFLSLKYTKASKGCKDKKEGKEHKIIVDESIRSMRYFITPADEREERQEEQKSSSGSEDEKKEAIETSCTGTKVSMDETLQINYLILRVSPTEENGLSLMSNSYQPGDDNEDIKDLEINLAVRRFIVIEFQGNNKLNELLELMSGNPLIRVMLDSGVRILPDEKDILISSLNRDDKKRWTRSRGNSYLRAVKPNDMVLNFPFDATYGELDVAAKGLVEANGFLTGTDAKSSGRKKQGSNSTSNDNEKFKNLWKHSHIVRGEDYERLSPGEYLNDTLIDLWMAWILRTDEASSDVHFFSTQFFQKIQDQGAESVESWTARRKIDIFEKKFIFIPINDFLHWSLCVVVNPGKIENAYNCDGDEGGEKDAPFLLFLDSLKAHKKDKVKRHIYSWLNLEAKRLKKFQHLNDGRAFWAKSMPMFEPKVPYQDNGWDCGVFVCRYAFSVLSLRTRHFKFDGSKKYSNATKDMNKLLRSVITDGAAFDFGMDDIKRLRQEFATLIDKLSDMFKGKHMAKMVERIEKQNQKLQEEKVGGETSNKSGYFI